MNDFTRLMNDPAYVEHARQVREREEREAHERRVLRGSHEPSSGPAAIRDMITRDRPFDFERDAHRSRSRSMPQQDGRTRGKRGMQFAGEKGGTNERS